MTMLTWLLVYTTSKMLTMLGWVTDWRILIYLRTVLLRWGSRIFTFSYALMAMRLLSGRKMATLTEAYAPYPMTLPTT